MAKVFNAGVLEANAFRQNLQNVNVEEVLAEQFAAQKVRMRNNVREVGQILDTVGIELESCGLYKDTVVQLLHNLPEGLGNYFKYHRDGSTEMNAYYVALNDGKERVIINAHTKEAEELFAGNLAPITQGYELVSVPMDIETAELAIWSLLPKLQHSGDFISERCATHIHVGMSKSLQIAKRLLRLGLWADELFYAIGAMGTDFRGRTNNCIYARPLISGPYVRHRGSYYQVLNWEAALDAKSLYDFYAAYHVDVNSGNFERQKYHPARYFSINLYSILLHSTLEFRHANQSFNPGLVVAFTKLCQMFTELGLVTKERDCKRLEPGNPFYIQSPTYYQRMLEHLVRLSNDYDTHYRLNDEDIQFICTAIDEFRGIGVKNVPVLTHIKEFETSGQLISEGKLKASKVEPIPDGHVDIHNIKYYSIMK